ncbi:MAG: hypothetical protein J0H40_17015 [Rhizobiales bacterium]|nr:hypothetical protein [Hyphomicrobiales bacterium]
MPRVKSSQLQRMSKLDRFFGDAPLVGDETQEEYDAFRAKTLSTLAAIKEIERRNEEAAEQLKRATRMIEGEFKQAAE